MQLGIYPVTVGLITDIKEYEQFCLKNKVPYDPIEPGSSERPPPGSTTWVAEKQLIVFYLDPTVEDLGVRIEIVAHEAAHGADQVFDFINESTDGVDEPYAYLVGHLAQWMYKKVPGWTQ